MQKLPFGWRFHICHDVPSERHGRYEIVFNIYDGLNNLIGRIGLKSIHENFLETHSYIHRGYRNIGLGKILYSKAFEYAKSIGTHICSSSISNDISYDAQRLWNSQELNKDYDIWRSPDRSIIFNKIITRDGL